MKSVSFTAKVKSYRIIYGRRSIFSVIQIKKKAYNFLEREEAEAWGCGTAIARKMTRGRTPNGWLCASLCSGGGTLARKRNLMRCSCVFQSNLAPGVGSADGVFLETIAADRGVLGAASISSHVFWLVDVGATFRRRGEKEKPKKCR